MELQVFSCLIFGESNGLVRPFSIVGVLHFFPFLLQTILIGICDRMGSWEAKNRGSSF